MGTGRPHPASSQRVVVRLRDGTEFEAVGLQVEESQEGVAIAGEKDLLRHDPSARAVFIPWHMVESIRRSELHLWRFPAGVIEEGGDEKQEGVEPEQVETTLTEELDALVRSGQITAKERDAAGRPSRGSLEQVKLRLRNGSTHTVSHEAVKRSAEGATVIFAWREASEGQELPVDTVFYPWHMIESITTTGTEVIGGSPPDEEAGELDLGT